MMIPFEDMNKLKSAADLRKIAEEAPSRLIKESIARAANQAASTGETEVEWGGDLDPDMKKELEDTLQWKITRKRAPDGGAPVGNFWIFSWKEESEKK